MFQTPKKKKNLPNVQASSPEYNRSRNQKKFGMDHVNTYSIGEFKLIWFVYVYLL